MTSDTPLKVTTEKTRASSARLDAPLNFLPPISVRQLLTILVMATAIPLLALALLFWSSAVTSKRQAALDALMNNVQTLASLVDSEIDTHLALAATLATSPALQTGDVAAFKLQAIQAQSVIPGTWINLSDPTGQLVMSTLLADGVPLPPRTTLDTMEQAWATRQPQVSDVIAGRITKRYNAFLEFPIFKDGKPLYSIVVGLNPERFLAIFRNSFSPDSVVGLLDRKRQFVARIPDHAGRVGTLASEGWRSSMAQSPQGFSETTTLEGEVSTTPYMQTKHGWTVGIAYLKRVTEDAARRQLWTLGLVGGALTLTSLLLGIGLASRIVSSMTTLRDVSRKIADGATVPAHALAVKEATEISRTLSVTSETLSAKSEDLRRAHDTFLNLVKHAPFGVYLIDAQFRITQISTGAEKAFANVKPLLGRDLAEVLRTIWPDRFADEAIAHFRHTLKTGESFRQSDLQETRRDIAEQEAYDWQLERVAMPNGEFGVVCYYYDLTIQKRAEEGVKFLLNELAHRMKNQLTVIQAMAVQTARRSDSAKQFQDQFFKRLQGLAVSTDLLVLRSGSGVPLENLIQRQLETFVPSAERLECDGPNLFLDPDATQTVGLALHELATNALKYGAWSSPRGRVTVSWYFVTNGFAEKSFRVSWLEQGGPVVVPPTRKGFGHVVINTMAAQRVAGEAELLYSPEGLSWTLTMPKFHIVTSDTPGGDEKS